MSALNGRGPGVKLSIPSMDGGLQSGGTENVKFCNKAAMNMNRFALASVSPMHLLLPNPKGM